MQSADTVRKQSKRTIGIGWKLFALLLAFVILMLGVIWLFQVRLLDYFYKQTKYRELEAISEMLAEYVGSDALDEATYSCAVDYSTCIRIFRQNNQIAVEVASADVSMECLIHGVPQSTLNEYYRNAKENGGVYAATKEMKPKLGTFWSENAPQNQPLFNIVETNDNAVGMVYNVIVTDDGGVEYMIILNAALTPVSATVHTLETQFIWIASVLTCAVILLAIVISRNISKPIIKMNRAAKKLAEGRYDVDFDGRGYREIRELADSLNFAAEELSRTDMLQRELIANVSHDLRTPLTLIRGYTEVMRDIPGENTPENLGVIAEEANHLSELVNDMLDLSRIRAGVRQPEATDFCLTDAVKEVMDRYEALVRNDGYRIDFIADGEAWITADRVMILQVVYNLINNAIHYSGEEKFVQVTQTVGENDVRISVIDRGEGISPEQIDRIWDRYYKVDRVHKRAAVGTGLGLSIVKGILEGHRATYGVESAEGVGSCFWFSLPLCKEIHNDDNAEDLT